MRDISDNDVKNKNIKFLPQKPFTTASAEVLPSHTNGVVVSELMATLL